MWNALAVSAFAKPARVPGGEAYLRLAAAKIRSLLGCPTEVQRLAHGRRAGKAAMAVFLADDAFLVQALLDLYEADFRADRLDAARKRRERPSGRRRSTALGTSRRASS